MAKTGLVNPEGHAAPYVRLFTAKGEFTERVSRFVYTYSEETDDKCQIVLTTLDQDAPDAPEFQEGAEWRVIWGYIDGLTSPTRKVYVRDVSPVFGPEGVQITMDLTDKLGFAKQNKIAAQETHTTVGQLVEDIAKTYGLTLQDATFFDDGSVVLNKLETSTIEVGEDGDPTVRKQNDLSGYSRVGARGDWIKTELKQIDITEKVFGSKSDFATAKGALDQVTGGPYYLQGRDDLMIIKKRNFGQAPYKVYTYKSDSELVSFKPGTNNKQRSGGASKISTNVVNRENKDFKKVDVTRENDNSPAMNAMLRSIDTDNYVASDPGIKVDESGLIVGTGPMKPTGKSNEVVSTGVNVFNSEKEAVENPLEPENPGYTLRGFNQSREQIGYMDSKSGSFITAVDNTATPYTPSAYISQKDIIQLATDEAEGIIEDMINNRRHALELDSNPGEIIVIGDPLMTDGKILKVQNTSKKYSGAWYLTMAQHSLDESSPYLTTGKVVRNAVGRTGNDAPNLLPAKSKNIPVIENQNPVNAPDSYHSPVILTSPDQPLPSYIVKSNDPNISPKVY